MYSPTDDFKLFGDDSNAKAARKALMYPLSGEPVDFNDLSSLVPDISVIAHSLSLQNRWHGNTKHYWSVAHHCMHAAAIFIRCREFFNVEEGSLEFYYVQLRLLLHDAGEAYTGDINTYLKHFVPELENICYKVQTHVECKLLSEFSGAPYLFDIEECDVEHVVHIIDKVCGWAEVRSIANSKCPLYDFVEDLVPEHVLINALSTLSSFTSDYNTPSETEVAYTARFSALMYAVKRFLDE